MKIIFLSFMLLISKSVFANTCSNDIIEKVRKFDMNGHFQMKTPAVTEKYNFETIKMGTDEYKDGVAEISSEFTPISDIFYDNETSFGMIFGTNEKCETHLLLFMENDSNYIVKSVTADQLTVYDSEFQETIEISRLKNP
jgi:hypothetical protein